MSESKLDAIVKGAPPPDVTAGQVAAAAAPTSPQDRLSQLRAPKQPSQTSDPTTLLPSSPPQIYLNLLILEASLRSQYLTLRARRRQYTFVLLLLSIWTSFFSWLLFFRPRDDGQVGGSKYWLVDMFEKVCLMAGVVTVILFWGTGQWERGIRWPRRWVGTTNRGLRSMNCKIVLMKGPWWRDMFSHMSFLIPYQLVFPTPGSSYHYVEYTTTEKRQLAENATPQSRERDRERGISHTCREEDIAAGGDYIKLLLLPKPFTPNFRENWELYRTEYWERENERRAELRKRVKQKQREIAKAEGGWLWWTGWRGWARARPRAFGAGTADVEKMHPLHHHTHSTAHERMLKDKKRRPSVLSEHGRSGSHSRSSSRSSTPTPDIDQGPFSDELKRERRLSSSSTASASERRRKRINQSSGSISGGRPTRLTPATPDEEKKPTLTSRSSNLSSASSDAESERSVNVKSEEKPPAGLEIAAQGLSQVSLLNTGGQSM